jgi:Predicted Fe-S oxidoreductases
VASLGENLDKIIEKNNKNSGSGAGALIAAIRILNKGAVRRVLRLFTKEVEFNGERKPLMDWVLAKYVGEEQCPTVAHFVAPFFEMGMKLATAWLHADEDSIKELLSDPALRRGIVTTLRGIALFGVTTPQKLPAPFFIVWNFTNVCNLKCIHCYQNAGRPLPNELTLEEKLELSRSLMRQACRQLPYLAANRRCTGTSGQSWLR